MKNFISRNEDVLVRRFSGRYRTNVWDYPGVNSFRAERLEDLALHPTVSS
jgi:hypothetical protein